MHAFERGTRARVEKVPDRIVMRLGSSGSEGEDFFSLDQSGKYSNWSLEAV